MAVLLAVVLVAGLLFMPARTYRGDAHAVRLATAQLILRGTLGIPYDQEDGVPPGFKRRRGQYFFENDDQQRYYSKYGVLQSLLYFPALWATQVDKGELKMGDRSREAIFWLNVNNVVVSLLIAAYLLLLARRFTRRPLVALGFVLCSMYASYVWYYLRAQSTEIFQLWFFLGFCYHFFRWADRGRKPWQAPGHFAAGMVYATLLTLTKAYYGLVFPLAWAALQLSSPKVFHPRRAFREALYLGGSTLMASALMLLQNRLTFGDWLSFGYFQAQADDTFAGNRFSADLLGEGLYRFLILPNRSFLVHFPLLIPAAFGVRTAWRRHRLELLLGLACFVVFLVFVSAQPGTGGWCLGPRYLVFVLPLLGLSAIPVLDWMVDTRRELGGAAALCALSALMLAQLWLNTRINRFEFHADWHIRTFLHRQRFDEAERYFDRRHAGMVFSDLAAFKRGEPFPPFETAKSLRPDLKAMIEARDQRFRRHWILGSNYYLFREK
jgi:hypothetical protein